MIAAFATLPVATSPAASLPQPVITTDPPMQPAFTTQTRDYTVPCPDGNVAFAAASPRGVSVSVDDGPRRNNSTDATITLSPGQRFTFTVNHSGLRGVFSSVRYSVRCRPADLPLPAVTRDGNPTANWILAAPMPVSSTNAPANYYAVVYNSWGTPVWWHATADIAVVLTRPGPGTMAYFAPTAASPFRGAAEGEWRLIGLDGAAKGVVRPGTDRADLHELTRRANGNYLVEGYPLRRGVDLSAFGKSSNANMFDAQISEVTPSGRLVWSWNSKDWISPAETGRWLTATPFGYFGEVGYDWSHINAIQSDGDSLLVSFRNLDAIYRIKPSGEIDWKLGGSYVPGKSLTVIGDDSDPALGAQHDVRRLPDGTISVFVNGSASSSGTDGKAPRAKRFRIDSVRRTATLLESISDPNYPSSFCCGSARRLPSRNWLISWGGGLDVTESSPSGSPVLTFKWATGWNTYRAVPASWADLPRASLLAGMDAMFPRGQ